MKVVITPEMAAEMLSRTEVLNYRQIDKRRVRQYADAMSSGEWEYNGETIKFDSQGNLVDGQHRLQASILASSSFVSEVVHGIDSSLEVDRGKGRRISDALRAMGIKSATNVAGIASLCWRYATENMLNVSMSPCVDVAVHIATRQKFLDKVDGAMRLPIFCRCAPVKFVFCLGGLGTPGEEHSDFWDGVCTGANLDDGDPRLVLRNRLTGNVGVKMLQPLAVGAITIKAFNAFMQDKPIACLKWSRFHKAKESYPILHNIPPTRAKALLGIVK